MWRNMRFAIYAITSSLAFAHVLGVSLIRAYDYLFDISVILLLAVLLFGERLPNVLAARGTQLIDDSAAFRVCEKCGLSAATGCKCR